MKSRYTKRVLLWRSQLLYKALTLMSITGFFVSCQISKKHYAITEIGSPHSYVEITPPDSVLGTTNNNQNQPLEDSIKIAQQDTSLKIIITPPITVTPCYGVIPAPMPNPIFN